MIITERDLEQATGDIKNILTTNLPLTDENTIEMVAKIIIAEFVKPLAEDNLKTIKAQSQSFREHKWKHEKLVQKHAKLQKLMLLKLTELTQIQRTNNRLTIQNNNLTNALTKLVLRSEE
jgi:hypothetical protein